MRGVRAEEVIGDVRLVRGHHHEVGADLLGRIEDLPVDGALRNDLLRLDPRGHLLLDEPAQVFLRSLQHLSVGVFWKVGADARVDSRHHGDHMQRRFGVAQLECGGQRALPAAGHVQVDCQQQVLEHVFSFRISLAPARPSRAGRAAMR